MRIGLLLFFHLLALCSRSQEGNNWYFGRHAGLSFNYPIPKALHDGALSTYEGCATMSDKKGQLLFYTDGNTVWNRNHQPMPNGTGLNGDSSSANAAIIIPRPGSETIYYIFTSDAAEHANAKGYNYSEVDITLNNGLGDLTANKNILLYAPSSEKLTAVRDANGTDIWVITHAWGSNMWYTYKVSCNGINTTPVISSAGSAYTETREVQLSDPNPVTWNIQSIGCLKASPDGRKIATTITNALEWEIFDFDNATGSISNGLNFHEFVPYGVEFSPDSRLLYISAVKMGYDSSYVKQFDLTSYDPVSIVSSEIIVGKTKIHELSSTDYSINALQLGPDDKIYCAVQEATYLSVINTPNTKGTGCNYINEQVDLEGKVCVKGLPVFFPSLITNKNIDFKFTAGNDCATVGFTGVSSIADIINWHWDFGDGQTASGQHVNHVYAPTETKNEFMATLTVTMLNLCGTGEAKASQKISLKRIKPVSGFSFDLQCGSTSVAFHDSSVIDAGGQIVKWLWDFGDGNTSDLPSPGHTYSGFGSYQVSLSTASDGACNGTHLIKQSITVHAKPKADVKISNACIDQPVSFTDNSTIENGTITNRYFSFGDAGVYTDASFQKIFTTAQEFTLKMVVASDFCASDTLFRDFTVEARPKADFTVSSQCVDSLVEFHDRSSIDEGIVQYYFWELGDGKTDTASNPKHAYAVPGFYTIKLVAISSQLCRSDTITQKIQIDSRPVAGFDVQNGCTGSPLEPGNGSTNDIGNIVRYEWDTGNGFYTGTEKPSFVFNDPGIYGLQLKVTSEHGCVSAAAAGQVVIHSIPQVAFGFDHSCIGDEIQFKNESQNQYGAITRWQWKADGEDKSDSFNMHYTFLQFGDHPVTLEAFTDNGCRASLTKDVSIKQVNVFAGRDTIVAIGQPLQITASGARDYLWTPAQYLSSAHIPNPTAILSTNFSYYLKGTTDEGCIGYDTLNIKVYKGPEIYVPTAFTPDGNKLNAVFQPIMPGVSSLAQFNVYNRWGQLVFSTNKIGHGWDGNFNGMQQPAGSFVWKLKAIDYMGRTWEKSGVVVLIR